MPAHSPTGFLVYALVTGLVMLLIVVVAHRHEGSGEGPGSDADADAARKTPLISGHQEGEEVRSDG